MKRTLFLLLTCVLIANVPDSIIRAADATNGPPTITEFSPVRGEIGASVEIRGTNLSGATSIQFNGAEASFSVLAGLLSATVPTNATTGPITIRTPNGTNTTSSSFTVVAASPPVIVDFSPITGEVGTSVEIRGTNLTSATSVKFNGVEATFNHLAGSILATVPTNATTGPISVTTPGGTHTTTASFTVSQRAAPIITGFSPTQGEPGASVEIQGTNLAGVTAVRFNGVTASFLSLSGTLRATVPAGATTGPITVVTTAGTNTSAQAFTVTSGPTPVITGFSPSGGEPGTAVEIRGNFLRDVTAVRFNDADALFTNSLFRPLSAIVPTNGTTGPITVITRAGAAISADLFIVTNRFAPLIDSLSPSSGTPGTIINILGTNLTGILSVQFQGIAANFVEFTSARLLVFVPTNALSGPVKVFGAKGNAVSKESFTVVASNPPPEPPVLSIRSNSEGKIQISWPSKAKGFVLQSADSLATPTSWSNETATVAELDERFTVTLDVVAGAPRFYRLVRQ